METRPRMSVESFGGTDTADTALRVGTVTLHKDQQDSKDFQGTHPVHAENSSTLEDVHETAVHTSMWISAQM